MAVAGQLVAVEVRDDVVRRPDVFEGVACKPLVALDQQDVRLDLAAEGRTVEHERRDALDLVGALLVPRHGLAVLRQDVGDHLHGGGVAVAARHGDDVRRQLHTAEDIGTELQRHLSGLAAALADELARKAQELADQDCQEFFHRCSPCFSCFVRQDMTNGKAPAGSARRRSASYYNHKIGNLQVFPRLHFPIVKMNNEKAVFFNILYSFFGVSGMLSFCLKTCGCFRFLFG